MSGIPARCKNLILFESFILLYVNYAIWRFPALWFDLRLIDYLISWGCRLLLILAISCSVQITHVPALPICAEVREWSLASVDMIPDTKVGIFGL